LYFFFFFFFSLSLSLSLSLGGRRQTLPDTLYWRHTHPTNITRKIKDKHNSARKKKAKSALQIDNAILPRSLRGESRIKT
jgi:hypothetical protein